MANRNTLERQLKALGSGRRLHILSELKRRKRADVSTIAKILGISQEGTSQHLDILSDEGIVVRSKRGLHAFYRLSLKQEQPVKKVIEML
jgi:DNA-binding transcriptional ArsR family regulator